MTQRRRDPIRCIQTGEVFRSCQAADLHFGWPIHTVACMLRGTAPSSRDGKSFEWVACKYDPTKANNADQKFKPIPGYEDKYSISLAGTIKSNKFKNRFKTVTITKQGQHVVVLCNGPVRQMYTVESLIKLAWYNIPLHTNPLASASRSKQVKCVEDNKVFKTLMDAAYAYNVEYGKFRKLLHSGSVIKGKHFELLK